MRPRMKALFSFLVLFAIVLVAGPAFAQDAAQGVPQIAQDAVQAAQHVTPEAHETGPILKRVATDSELLRIVLGLGLALGLAVAATHPFVRRIERRLGLTLVTASGLPFILMGLIFRHPRVGILTDSVLADLRPALEFGVGWLGFAVGMKFNLSELDRVHPKTGAILFAETAIPVVTTTIACSLFFIFIDYTQTFPILASIHSYADFKRASYELSRHASFRDAIALGACAAQAAPVAALAIARSSGSRGARILEHVSQLDDVAGIFVISLVCAFFRPTESFAAWKLPHIAWLFVILGLGGVLGILAYVLVRSAKTRTEEIAYLLGAIALSAGMSGYLGISPLITGAIAGALLANLPQKEMARLKETIEQVERPLFLIFLLVAGALWDPRGWQGWVLCPLFVLSRIVGKLVGARAAKRVGPEELPDATTMGLALSPQSPMVIVTVVSFVTIYKGADDSSHLPWLMTACIFGALLTEVTVQWIVRVRGGLSLDPRSVGTHSLMPPPDPDDPAISLSMPPAPVDVTSPPPTTDVDPEHP